MRVERLQQITEADAIAEGVICENVVVGASCAGGRHAEITADRYFLPDDDSDHEGDEDAISAFARLWDRLHTKPGERWDDNPWVVRTAFDVHSGNIDRASQS